MRLVESVAGELLHQIEDVRGLLLRHAALDRAVHEDGALLRHLLGLFLAHRATQQVGAAERVAGQHLRDLHDLLLVQDHAVGRLQNLLQARMQIVDGPVDLAVLAVDEVIDHARLQRARAEQRDERHDVLEAVRLQAPHEVLHAARLELEDRGRAAGLQQREGLRIRPSGSQLISSGGSPFSARMRLMISSAQSMIVSVRRPRKSNFTSPAASTSSLSNCVTTLPPARRSTAARSQSAPRAR